MGTFTATGAYPGSYFKQLKTWLGIVTALTVFVVGTPPSVADTPNDPNALTIPTVEIVTTSSKTLSDLEFLVRHQSSDHSVETYLEPFMADTLEHVAELEAAFIRYETATEQVAALEIYYGTLLDSRNRTETEIRQVETRKQQEAIASYINSGDTTSYSTFTNEHGHTETVLKETMIGALAQGEQALLQTLTTSHQSLLRNLVQTAALHTQTKTLVETAETDLGHARAALIQSMETLEKADQIAQGGSWVFPIDGEHQFQSDYGFGRSGGRSHKGNDLFATRGTPVVAVTDGFISGKGYGELGGWKLFVTDHGGNRYYYAHLDSFAPGIENGTKVVRGQVLGHVGDTGNAKGTPPHLHFEIRPAGASEPIDPYNILKIASTIWYEGPSDTRLETQKVLATAETVLQTTSQPAPTDTSTTP